MRKYLVLALSACLCVLALGLFACSGSGDDAADADLPEATGTEEGAEDEPMSGDFADEPVYEDGIEGLAEGDELEEDAAADSADDAEPAAAVEKVDVSTVDYDVAAMADEEAFSFMDTFLNRTPDELDAEYGKVMRIQGKVSRNAKVDDDGEHVSYSVGVKGEGGVIWAIPFYVDGWSPDDYPENGSTALVTGVYSNVDGYGSSAGRTLVCNAEDVETIE